MQLSTSFPTLPSRRAGFQVKVPLHMQARLKATHVDAAAVKPKMSLADLLSTAPVVEIKERPVFEGVCIVGSARPERKSSATAKVEPKKEPKLDPFLGTELEPGISNVEAKRRRKVSAAKARTLGLVPVDAPALVASQAYLASIGLLTPANSPETEKPISNLAPMTIINSTDSYSTSSSTIAVPVPTPQTSPLTSTSSPTSLSNSATILSVAAASSSRKRMRTSTTTEVSRDDYAPSQQFTIRPSTFYLGANALASGCKVRCPGCSHTFIPSPSQDLLDEFNRVQSADRILEAMHEKTLFASKSREKNPSASTPAEVENDAFSFSQLANAPALQSASSLGIFVALRPELHAPPTLPSERVNRRVVGSSTSSFTSGYINPNAKNAQAEFGYVNPRSNFGGKRVKGSQVSEEGDDWESEEGLRLIFQRAVTNYGDTSLEFESVKSPWEDILAQNEAEALATATAEVEKKKLKKQKKEQEKMEKVAKGEKMTSLSMVRKSGVEEDSRKEDSENTFEALPDKLVAKTVDSVETKLIKVDPEVTKKVIKEQITKEKTGNEKIVTDVLADKENIDSKVKVIKSDTPEKVGLMTDTVEAVLLTFPSIDTHTPVDKSKEQDPRPVKSTSKAKAMMDSSDEEND